MDIVTMILIEDQLHIPLDIVVFINGWVKYEQLNDKNINSVVKLWSQNQEKCKFIYGNISYWNTSNVTRMDFLFQGLFKFNEDISRWNVSKVTNMYAMFSNATQFNNDISNWDVGQVTNMHCMFHNAKSFNSNLTLWNVSNVLYMGYMFQGAISFSGDISQWNISKVVNMPYMFNGAISFDPKTVSRWNIENVKFKNNLFDQ